jgi:hypothetical protein
MNNISFNFLYNEAKSYYENLKDIDDEYIYEIVNRAIHIVLKYQKIKKEYNIEEINKIILIIFNWLFIQKFYEKYDDFFKEYLNYIQTDNNIEYDKYKIKYNKLRYSFWQKWTLLRNNFPECWKTFNWQETNIPLYELKKDLYFNVQKYLHLFNQIYTLQNINNGVYHIYIEQDRSLFVKDWLNCIL